MKSGIAVALAWPETYCKQAGGWYDDLLSFFGINKGHYYQAGHAALLLIERFSSTIHYYDFGRYHAPKGHGRVRSAHTDPELSLTLSPEWSPKGDLLNLSEILKALNANPAYHGDGILHAGQTDIHFEKGLKHANYLQSISPIKYGPFTYSGSNCSRFVNSVLLRSGVDTLSLLRLYLPHTLTPSPLSNVRSLGNRLKDGERNRKPIPVCSHPKLTLQAPKKPDHLPEHAQWLAGEGSGSWFVVEDFFEEILVNRFNPEGELEFGGIYQVKGKKGLNLNLDYSITYLSHFRQIRILQHRQLVELSLIAISKRSQFNSEEVDKPKIFRDYSLT